MAAKTNHEAAEKFWLALDDACRACEELADDFEAPVDVSGEAAGMLYTLRTFRDTFTSELVPFAEMQARMEAQQE